MRDDTPVVLKLPFDSPKPLYSPLAADPDLADLVATFVDHLPDRVSAMQRAVEDADNDALRHLAHQLKGSAGGYGFGAITSLAGEIEWQAKLNGDMDDLRGALDELSALCHRATAAPAPGSEYDPLPPAA